MNECKRCLVYIKGGTYCEACARDRLNEIELEEKRKRREERMGCLVMWPEFIPVILILAYGVLADLFEDVDLRIVYLQLKNWLQGLSS